MKTVLCLIVILLFTVTVYADERTVALESELKLKKPITLCLRAATLREVLAAVEKATGVHLLAQRDIAEDKATVYVTDQPAMDVLRAVAHCFNLCWSPSPPTADKPYLLLWMDRSYLASIDRRQYQDYLSITAQFDQELIDTAKLIRSGTEFRADQATIDKLSNRDFALRVRLEKRTTTTTDPAQGAMVLQFLVLSDKKKESLYKGEHVKVSGAEICPEALKRWPAAKSLDYAMDRTMSGCILRCAGRPGEGTTSIASAYFDYAPYQKEADRIATEISADRRLDKPLPDGFRVAEETDLCLGEGSAAVPSTMSDGLLEVAKAAKIAIVAQYASEYKSKAVDWEKQTVKLTGSSAKTVGERLAELGKEHLFAVVRDGDFLLARSLLWHRQRVAELPEARIRGWQKDLCGLPKPTLKTYLDMGSTRWEQIRAIVSNARFWFGDQWLPPVASCEYGLKIYGGMTQEQQRWLMSGRPVPVWTLTPDQQYCFMRGFEVKEYPTFEHAADPNWPATASISFQDIGFNGAELFATSEMRILGRISPDKGTLGITDETSQAEARKILNAKMTGLLPSMILKLRRQVAKDHPEVAAERVSIYSVRDCVFTLKLGDRVRQCNLPYSVMVW